MPTQMNTENVSEIVCFSVDHTLVGFDDLLTEEIIVIYQWITLAFVCQIVDLFGVGTNIVNIICFIKQGFCEPVNVSLLGLALSDLGCLATLIWTNICFTPAFATADLPFDPTEIQYLTSSMPHATFARITAWITALITLERCLCITVPLKVKNIVTTKRVSVIIIIVYVILISSAAPTYVVTTLGMKFSPVRNKSILGLVYANSKGEVEKASYLINNTIVPCTAFIIIITGTTMLVVSLQAKTKWRNKSTSLTQADNVSGRNRRIAKMVVIISIIFISCFIPFGLIFLAMSIEPEFSITGKYKNILTIVGGLGLVLESINSAGNIFIYYKMSSKYRTTFKQMFHISD